MTADERRRTWPFEEALPMAKPLKGSGPCPRRWDELAGDGPSRFCASCRKVVHDLDALTAAEIEELTRANPDGFCATFIAREDRAFSIPAQAASSVPIRVAAFAAVVAAAIIGCSSPADVSTNGGAKEDATAAESKPTAECTKPLPTATAGELTAEQRNKLRYLGYVN
jgi:hypothetical protein